MPALFTNNATTTLASGITNSATSLSVAASTGALFPAPTGNNYFYCTLAGTNGIEIIKVTARASDTFTVVRAQDGTTGKAYSTGETVELRPVAAAFAIDALLPDQTGNSGKLLTTNGTSSSWGALTTTGSGSTYALSASPTFTGTVTVANFTVGSSSKIKGDFSNATRANRTLFQDNTLNNATNVGVVPNGTGTSGSITAFNSSDPDNASLIQFIASSTAVQIVSNSFGTGTLRSIDFAMGATTYLTLTTDGRLYGTALHNNAGSVTGTTNQYIASGTYTPTVTNIANIDSTTMSAAQWKRVGNVVSVSGTVAVDPTTTATVTQIDISLPIASTFGAASERCCGTCTEYLASSGVFAGVISGASTNLARLSYKCNSASSTQVYFHFTYVIV